MLLGGMLQLCFAVRRGGEGAAEVVGVGVAEAVGGFFHALAFLVDEPPRFPHAEAAGGFARTVAEVAAEETAQGRGRELQIIGEPGGRSVVFRVLAEPVEGEFEPLGAVLVGGRAAALTPDEAQVEAPPQRFQGKGGVRVGVPDLASAGVVNGARFAGLGRGEPQDAGLSRSRPQRGKGGGVPPNPRLDAAGASGMVAVFGLAPRSEDEAAAGGQASPDPVDDDGGLARPRSHVDPVEAAAEGQRGVAIAPQAPREIKERGAPGIVRPCRAAGRRTVGRVGAAVFVAGMFGTSRIDHLAKALSFPPCQTGSRG